MPERNLGLRMRTWDEPAGFRLQECFGLPFNLSCQRNFNTQGHVRYICSWRNWYGVQSDLLVKQCKPECTAVPVRWSYWDGTYWNRWWSFSSKRQAKHPIWKSAKTEIVAPKKCNGGSMEHFHSGCLSNKAQNHQQSSTRVFEVNFLAVASKWDSGMKLNELEEKMTDQDGIEHEIIIEAASPLKLWLPSNARFCLVMEQQSQSLYCSSKKPM